MSRACAERPLLHGHISCKCSTWLTCAKATNVAPWWAVCCTWTWARRMNRHALQIVSRMLRPAWSACFSFHKYSSCCSSVKRIERTSMTRTPDALGSSAWRFQECISRLLRLASMHARHANLKHYCGTCTTRFIPTDEEDEPSKLEKASAKELEQLLGDKALQSEPCARTVLRYRNKLLPLGRRWTASMTRLGDRFSSHFSQRVRSLCERAETESRKVQDAPVMESGGPAGRRDSHAAESRLRYIKVPVLEI